MKKLVIILFFSLSLNMPMQLQSSWVTAAKVAAIPVLWAGNYLVKNKIEYVGDILIAKKMQDAHFKWRDKQYVGHKFPWKHTSIVYVDETYLDKQDVLDELKHRINRTYAISGVISMSLSGALVLAGGLVKSSVYLNNKYLPGIYEMYTQGYIEKYILPKIALYERLDKFINGNMFTSLTVLSFVPTITYTLCRAYNYYKLHQLTKKWQAEKATKDLAAQQARVSTSTNNPGVETRVKPLIPLVPVRGPENKGNTNPLASAQNTSDEVFTNLATLMNVVPGTDKDNQDE